MLQLSGVSSPEESPQIQCSFSLEKIWPSQLIEVNARLIRQQIQETAINDYLTL
jgi:hypothetical protein